MKVVIIEDESLVAKDLVKLLSKIEPDFQIVKIIGSVEQAQNYFNSNPMPDLIFSDIQLSDGVSFDLFKDQKINCPIIFTTAYDQYAIAAFKLNSIDYLLKPIDEEDLQHALAKFKKLKNNLNTDLLTQQFQEMMMQLTQKENKKYKNRFTGHLGKSIVAVPEEEVAYFVKNEIIFLVTSDNKQLVTDYQSLDEMESILDPEKFIRANRQYIVSINAIDTIKTHFTGKLSLELKQVSKEEITVSREKASEFKKWLDNG